MAVSPRQRGDDMDLDSLKRVIDSPWTKGAARLSMLIGPWVVAVVFGFFASQVNSMHDAQSNIFGRVSKVESTVGTIQSTQADGERFQSQILASLEGIKNDVIAIKINEASMNTILREHFPNVGERQTGVSPAMAMQP